ncbi:MAG: hypothetical protein SGI96_17335 [Bacteroidota bacterium]|nr:hypothetical protein [Bacteroidota bacterium]
MKKTPLLLLFISICFCGQAQKKNKDKDKSKDKQEASVNFTPQETTPVADTTKKFTGVIKYRMTSDDPSDRDSIIIVFGESRIRVIMFLPGYREDQVFERSMIANLKDSTFLELDARKKTYKTEKLSVKNEGTELSVAPEKKTVPLLNFACHEYKGQMTTKDGEVFQTACLVSNQHSYMAAMDYNFLGIQPLVMSYKIVLGLKTRTSDNENTYIMAYKIEPGNTDAYFDLSGYKAL